ncbi:hypothetical protein HPB47_013994 [Ixodes persulcatus]|uniref:Uncharacterized protein n=1 Tax=Ixodes persulcatus TaxID=34615 RepID=A0AC60QX22_IXOPE|nr:hypothetical protein HPB47_013994 [Ixodes persulcatus]
MDHCELFFEVVDESSDSPAQDLLSSSSSIPFHGVTGVTVRLHRGGQFIPKDTGILYNIYAINHDPNLWDDPEVFRPERFLDPVTGKIKQELLPQLMSFGLGPRTCPGEKLAHVDMFYVFVRFMQRVDMSAPEGKADAAIEPVGSNLFLVPWEENIVLTRKD